MKHKLSRILPVLAAIILAAALCACAPKQKRESIPLITSEPTTVAPTTMPPTDKIESLLDEMSTEEKVGQLFFARCPDVNAVESVSQYHIGGYLLFGRDFFDLTKEQVMSNIQDYQDEAKIPLFIGVDEEGGTVVRVSDNMYLSEAPFDSPKNIYLNGGWEAVDSTEYEKARLLKSLGINVNFAPVCDIVSDPNSFMYDRSFSSQVEEVNTFVNKSVTAAKQQHVGTVLKHFPGYGDNSDTHVASATDERSLADFEKTDFQPFRTGIACGADCVLVSHNIVSCMDPEKPASLSEKVHEILRNDLNFDGVIITDDLAMEAIGEYTGTDSAAVAAFKSGNDMLCCSDLDAQYNAVLAAVQSGEISEERLDESVKRILNWKLNLGILTEKENGSEISAAE